jgi:hypothetical protein
MFGPHVIELKMWVFVFNMGRREWRKQGWLKVWVS